MTSASASMRTSSRRAEASFSRDGVGRMPVADRRDRLSVDVLRHSVARKAASMRRREWPRPAAARGRRAAIEPDRAQFVAALAAASAPAGVVRAARPDRARSRGRAPSSARRDPASRRTRGAAPATKPGSAFGFADHGVEADQRARRRARPRTPAPSALRRRAPAAAPVLRAIEVRGAASSVSFSSSSMRARHVGDAERRR